MNNLQPTEAKLSNFFTIGERLYKAGAHAAAVRSLEIAVTRGENADQANYLLGQCYKQLGRPESAASAFEKARKLGYSE